jgi:flavoprotein hydroxylase
VICVTDPAAAADRDASMLAGARGRPPASPEPAKPLAQGLLAREPRSRPGRGEVMPQGRVTRGGRTALFDDAVGTGFVLLSTTDPRHALGPDRRAALARWGCHLVQVLPAAAPADPADLLRVADTEGVYQEFFKAHGVSAVLVRPDYYVFGAVPTAEALPALADELLRRTHYRAA